MEDRRRRNLPAHMRRRGVAVFETILVLPIMVAAVFSIVEFSLLVNRQQHLLEACRNGAVVASQLTAEVIKSTPPGSVPEGVQAAVKGRLAEVNIRQVDIQFSYGREAQAQIAAEHEARGCRASVKPLGECVRVSITVPATQLSPNLLGVFGFDISQRTYSAASVMPYKQGARGRLAGAEATR